MHIEMMGRSLTLVLEESGIVTSETQMMIVGDDGIEREIEPTASHFRGYVAEERYSEVRISESNGYWVGLIDIEGEIFVIEPGLFWPSAQLSSDASHVAYRLSEAGISADEACGAAHAPNTRSSRRHRAERRFVDSSNDSHGAVAQGVAGLLTTEISLVGDYQYHQASNTGTNPGTGNPYSPSEWMNAVINAVDLIYTNEVGITFTVAHNIVYTTPNDPFPLTPTGDGCQSGKRAGDVLAEFAGTRSSGQYPWSLANSDVAHLFTGRPLCGSSGSSPQNVIGIAYYNGICSSGTGTGVSEDWSTGLGSMTTLVAHEIGHNFNAPHDSSNCSGVAPQQGQYCCIMEPSLGGSCPQNQFSNASDNTITSYAAGRSCLDSGPTATPTHTFTPSNTPTPTNTPTNTATPTPTPVNLAVAGVAYQSSTAYGGLPSRAVDGNTNGNWSGASVTATGMDSGAWWEVDLGDYSQIVSIKVFNRTDCCSSRLQNYHVLVSDTPFPEPGQSGVFDHFEAAIAGSPTTIPVNAGGRYVRIQLQDSGILSLAEVRILGYGGVPQPPQNLSLGKNTLQSSTIAGGVSSRAVDGNQNGNWGGGSVTATSLEADAWWQVDLGSVSEIVSIDIFNRTDCCGSRLQNYYVLISDDPSPQPGQPGVVQLFQSAIAGSPTSIPVNASGRFVRIQLTDPDYLSIAEVQVWGFPGSSPTGENLSEDRPTSQSSTLAGAASVRAVDGNTSGNWAEGSVTATASEDNPWWQVDLGAIVEIGSIDIYNRTDCCSSRLAEYYVLVSNSADEVPGGGSVVFQQFEADAAESPTSISVGASGRYVKIIKTTPGYLSLAEVQVWGPTPP